MTTKIGFKDLKWSLRIPIITAWGLTIIYATVLMFVVGYKFLELFA